MRDVGTFASYPTDLLKEQSRVIACSIKDPIKACFISMYLSLSLAYSQQRHRSIKESAGKRPCEFQLRDPSLEAEMKLKMTGRCRAVNPNLSLMHRERRISRGGGSLGDPKRSSYKLARLKTRPARVAFRDAFTAFRRDTRACTTREE